MNKAQLVMKISEQLETLKLERSNFDPESQRYHEIHEEIKKLTNTLGDTMNSKCPIISQSERRGIELNGIANIKMIMDFSIESHNDGTLVMTPDVLEQMQEQLDLLERYLLAYNKAVNDNVSSPFWHEVTHNPSAYPTNNEIKR